MAYINRDLEDKIKSASKEYACILITGARQVGKSTVLKQLMDENREEVLLDDIEERKMWRSETGKLKRFIERYSPYIDGLQCVAGHCSKYDNYNRL